MVLTKIANVISESIRDIDSVGRYGGVAVLNGESVEELIEKADKKLYEAKNTGRNRIKG